MKKFNLLNFSLACALMAAPNIGVAQDMDNFDGNWYINYVGNGRVVVTSPSSIAKSLTYTIANDGDGTGDWGAVLPTTTGQVVKASPYEACSGVAAGSLTGKIALILRGNCEFGVKAKNAQDAGAVMAIIVNQQDGGPVGMGAGAVGSTVTIPVLMISKTDGAMLSSVLDASGTVNMSFSKWESGHTNDLAILDRGIALGHSWAMPYHQMTNASNVDAYKMVDGAVIANFGTSTATNVRVESKLTWTPDGGGATVVKTHTMPVGTFAPGDSVKSPFFDETYSLPNATGAGRFDLEYYVASDNQDDFTGDDTMRASFYVTNNLLSKGRYNDAASKPFANSYIRYGTNDFMHGPLFYVANGGYKFEKLQTSISNGLPDDNSLSGSMTAFIWKWVDGTNGQPADGKMQSGEATIVGTAFKEFTDPAVDTSQAMFTMNIANPDNNNPVVAESNTWYWVALSVPAGYFMASDGETNYQPRAWARRKSTAAYLEPWAITFGGNDGTFLDDQSTQAGMFPSEGATINVDSVRFAEQRDGHVGALPVYMSVFPVSVQNVTNNATDINLYPNPATDVLNVSLNLQDEAKSVTYIVMDASGRRVSEVNRKNIKNDTYQIATADLSAGNYFLVIGVDDKANMRQFTIVK